MVVLDGIFSKHFTSVNMKDKHIVGLKCHDYNVIMQQLLPIIIQEGHSWSQL